MEERVQKIIAQAGICSRRKAEELIEDGKVQVNNKIITIGDKADAIKDTILVNGEKIKKEKIITYLLHKPKGYITTSDDMYNRKKVLDLVPLKPRVFAVGRLDRDASGLLILTNDGNLANKIMHPSHEVKKTYIAMLDSPFRKESITKARTGVYLDKQLVQAEIILLEPTTVAVTIHVGIHKVVKRLLKELGYYVKHLHRTHVGSLALDVEEGSWRIVTDEDKKLIFSKNNITKETFLEQ